MIKPQSFTAHVVSNEYIAKETRKTVFKVKSDSFTFKTGQFVNIKVEPKIMRAYSVASSSSCLPELELCVKVVENGLGSGYIDRMEPGQEVEFMGPFGHFGTKKTEKKLLMVATGTGIAPMRAITEELSEQEFNRKTTLVFGVREEEYASYNQYFKTLSEQYNGFSYSLFVSRPRAEFTGQKGRVTDYITNLSPESLENTEVLICGNPAMVKEVQRILKEDKSVDKSDIVVEAY